MVGEEKGGVVGKSTCNLYMSCIQVHRDISLSLLNSRLHPVTKKAQQCIHIYWGDDREWL